MTPTQPSSHASIDASRIRDATEQTIPSLLPSAVSIQSNTASQTALLGIYRALDLVKRDFDKFIHAGLDMTDDLCSLVTSKTDMERVKAFDKSYDTVKKTSQDAASNIEKLSTQFSRQKKDAQNVVAFGNCKSKLDEHRQFQQLMQDWTKIADSLSSLKTSFVDVRLTAHRLKVIDGLPQSMREQTKFIEQARNLETKALESLLLSCDAHLSLLKAIQIILPKLDKNADSEAAGSARYDWANEIQSEICLELMNATVAVTSAAARALHLHVDPENQRVIDAYYPIVMQPGPAHENHLPIFEDLVAALRRKIAGYGLYEKTITLIESSDALKEFWQKPIVPVASEALHNRIQRHLTYKEFRLEGCALIPKAKADDLFSLVIAHQAHIEKLQKPNQESTGLDWDTEGVASGIDLEAAIESYFCEMRLSTSVIKTMIAEGKFSEPELSEIKNRLGALIHSSALHQSQRAKEAHRQLMVKASEMQGKNTIDPADATNIALLYAYFARCFQGAAKAAYDNVPTFDDGGIDQKIADARSSVVNCIADSWECALKLNDVTIGHPELDRVKLDATSPLARAYNDIVAMMNDIARTVQITMASGDRILLDQMFLDLNQYETNLHILKLRTHDANPVQDFDKLIGEAIAHATRETRRANGLHFHWRAKLDAMTDTRHESNPDVDSRIKSAREVAEMYRSRARKMQQRVEHWQILAMLEDHPSLSTYYEMVRSQYNRFHSEMKRLKERPPGAENVLAAMSAGTDSVSDSDLRLLNDLSQFELDIHHFNYKFKKKFHAPNTGANANRNAGFDIAFACLQGIQSRVQSFLREATDLIGIDPNEPRQSVPTNSEETNTWEIEPDSVKDTEESNAHEADIEGLTASTDAAQLSPPSPARLAIMMTEMNERSQRVADILNSASGWANFGRELAEDGCNPAHAKKFFTRAADCQDQAAALLDINERLFPSHFTGQNTNKHTAAQIRAHAENTRLEGDTVFTRLTKSKELPFDRDVQFVLDNQEIHSIQISAKKSYTPKNPATGRPRVDHNNQELVEWMKEITIKLKPEDGQEYPTWIVHLHYRNKHSEDFKISHAKKFEDRMTGTSTGKVERQYISHANARRLLRWEPTN